MATNTNVMVSGSPRRAMDVNIVGVGANGSSSNVIGSGGVSWIYNTSAKGTVGAELTITPSVGNKQAFEFIIVARDADPDATLVIKRDSTTIFSGDLANLDRDGSIKFPSGSAAATVWKVTVTGGDGDLFVLVRHN